MRWDGRACLQPFVDYFVQCDNYAGSLYGRAVTVECVDRYGMKLISKVFVKMCAAKTPLRPLSLLAQRQKANQLPGSSRSTLCRAGKGSILETTRMRFL